MEYVKADVAIDGQTARFGQIMSTDPAVTSLVSIGSQRFSLPAQADAGIDNVVRSQNHEWQLECVPVLAAHFFLQALGYGIK